MIFSPRSLLPLLLLLALSGCFLQSRPKRAQRQLLKEQHARAKSLLQKDIAKDSINPAAYWLLSQLYLDTAYRQHLDTAHLLILQAQRQAPLEDKKDRKRWRKLGLDSTALALQHSRVDSAAFARAIRLHTVAGYQYFLSYYPLAAQVPEATELRNALAFAAAEAINTWQAYQQFFQTYPQARQVAEARDRYEDLLFRERTQTGTLQAFRRFLEEHPQTPYRDRLLRNIYRLSTAGHTPQSYDQYISRYPASPYNRQALVQLYYLHGNPQTLWQTYPHLPRPDSLQPLVALARQQVIAVLQGGKWGFAAEGGSFALPPSFDDVHPDYLCESLEHDFAEVFVDGQVKVVAWNGQPLLQQDYEQLSPLSGSLLRIQQDGRHGLLLKNGEWLLPPDYTSIRLLGPDLVLARQEAQMGLLAPNGQWLLMLQADSISRQQDFVLRHRQGRIAVHSREQLIRAAQENRRLQPTYAYSSVRLLEDSLLLAIRPDNSWEVLRPDLRPAASGPEGIPMAIRGGFVVQLGTEYQILNEVGQLLLPGRQQQLFQRQNMLAVKQADSWGLWQLPQLRPLRYGYDSLQLLHPQLVWTRNKGQDSLHFMGEQPLTIALQPQETVRLLRPQQVPDSLNQQRDQYDMVVVTSGRNLRIFSLRGRQILQGRYAEASAPDPALLLLKTERGTVSLADTSGQILLKPGYDAIGNYQQGALALLKGGRFGLYNPYRQLLLAPQFDAAPRPYASSLLIASRGRQWGLVDETGKTILPHRYEAIQYWTDSLALAKVQDEWQLLQIHTGDTLLRGIFELNWLRDPQAAAGGMAMVETREGYGIISTQGGVLAPPVYDDIQNLGTREAPLFYLERKNREEGTYAITYLNQGGTPIFEQVYSQAEWELLLCD